MISIAQANLDKPKEVTVLFKTEPIVQAPSVTLPPPKISTSSSAPLQPIAPFNLATTNDETILNSRSSIKTKALDAVQLTVMIAIIHHLDLE